MLHCGNQGLLLGPIDDWFLVLVEKAEVFESGFARSVADVDAKLLEGFGRRDFQFNLLRSG